MKKVGRNDPCPCGSGKKFKKCCESSMLGGRFKASKIDSSSLVNPQKMSQLTGLFHTKIAKIQEPEEVKPPIEQKASDEISEDKKDPSLENFDKEIES